MLSTKRLSNYKKLLRETNHIGLNAKQREREKINGIFSGFGSLKQVRDYIKHKSDKR